MHSAEAKVPTRTGRWAIPALIVALAVLAYGATVRNGFVWDDETFIVNNTYVHDLSQWPSYFTRAESITAAPDPGLLRMYRPLQTLSFAVDVALWGRWSGGYHLTSLLIHIFSCWAIIFAFGPLVGRRSASIAALLFAVHPALSEGVLSLAARGNQLYTLFGLLSIGWFVRIERPLDRRHILSVATALLAFFSKEPAIVLVVLLPVLQAVFGRPGRLRDRLSVRIHMPYLLAAVLFLVARMLVVDTSSPVPYWGGSLGKTLLMQARVFVTYWRMLIWPWPLLGRYPVPYFDPHVVLHVLINVVMAVLAAVLYLRGGKARLAALAVVWFYITLAPVSNIIPIPGNMTGERFLYFTYAGLFPFLAAVAVDALPARFAKAAGAAGISVLCLFVVMDVKRTPVWRDNLRFFSVLAGQVPEGEPVVQVLLAKEEVLAGMPEQAVKRLARVVDTLSAYTPAEKTAAYYWYGRALLDSDHPREAFDQFATVVLFTKSLSAELVPYIVEASARSGRLGFAESLLSQELRRAPNNDVLWNDLGNVLMMTGDRKGASDAYERALAINPSNREAAANLLRAHGTAGGAGR